MSEIIYHVFFEDHQEGVGLYIGSYKEKDRADKIGNYVWDLFENTGIDKTDEIIEAVKLWRKYRIYTDTEYSRFQIHAMKITSGLSSMLVFESVDVDFVQKYTLFRGMIQPELFTREFFEHCVMYQHKEKRLLAQKKAARRGKDLTGLKNQILVNGFSEKMQKQRFGDSAVDRFIWKEIEVAQKFYDRLEKTDYVTINLNDKTIRSEICDFENYFRCDVELKARIYDEVKNILYCDLEDAG